MRSHAAICIAVLLALSGSAFAAQAPAMSSQACTRAPHTVMRQRTPQMIAAHREMRQACAADEARFCANVPKGCGQEKQCMMAHQADLSSSCTSAMQNLRTARHGA